MPKPSKTTRQNSAQRGVAASAPALAEPLRGAAFAAALLGSAVAIGASAILSLGAFPQFTLPGCGPKSACAAAAASAWGKLPAVNVPVSFVGLAFFLAMLAALLATGRRVSGGLRTMARLGALVSALYLAIMVIERTFCVYCIAAHAGNLVFFAAVELSRRGVAPAGASLRAVGAAGGAFVLALGGLVLGQSLAVSAAKADAQSREDAAVGRVAQQMNVRPAAEPVRGTLTGRYRLGPEDARVRVVVFSCFTCPLCRNVESELLEILARRPDVSLSPKVFPLGAGCNATLPRDFRNARGDGCPAARVALAAGQIMGSEGFFQASKWLFEKSGSFTEAELDAQLTVWGYDPEKFRAAMAGPEVQAQIRADTEEAQELGIPATPFFFINGEEFPTTSLEPRGSVTRLIERVAASAPTPASADRPPTAIDRALAQFRASPVTLGTSSGPSAAVGPEGAPFQFVLFGDYQVAFLPDLDRELRSLATSRTDVRYVFRHFPMHGDCNPVMRRPNVRTNPFACRTTAAAIVAGRLAGPDGFWKMHGWLLSVGQGYSDNRLFEQIKAMGLDPAVFFSETVKPEVRRQIETDAAALNAAAPGKGGGALFLNGRFVPVPKVGEAWILARLLDEAAKPSAPVPGPAAQ
ncbi:MAG: thioredoxin domain-containing protein [Phycisphaerales bacterium]|nr:thioredoxin domain-containing protein [Phycisphaerales bacterium]